ncbi:MAG: dTDP-glucose 4,6-dehydratase [Bacteroidales bacterium]|nr:dTDP-glucose 4,6-dehydratase [Bacteroidales bacterium]
MYRRSIIITGGAGFIGSHVVRLFVNKYPDYRIINLDKLTYAGNLANLKDIEDKPNYKFVRMDVCDCEGVLDIMKEERVDGIIHLAAETHVDRSIKNPSAFAETNVIGTLSMLQAAKACWESLPDKWEGKRFHHVSTDEVYGALKSDCPEGSPHPDNPGAVAYGTEFFTEDTPYRPHSPYSAAKAASDHFVRAFHDTYGLPTTISNCSNNYGPYQFPEKLIPLCINNIYERRPIPVYGRGLNVRDWLYVGDHADAIDLIFHKGRVGQTYNVGGAGERRNIDLVRMLVEITDRILGRPEGADDDLITFVTDRAGHDDRYAIDSGKLSRELGWKPSVAFGVGLEKTVAWYLGNRDWLDGVTGGEYMNYYAETYTNK